MRDHVFKPVGMIDTDIRSPADWDRIERFALGYVRNKKTGKLVRASRLNNGTLSQYGMGWMLDSDPQLGRIVDHTGHNPGYANHIIRMIDKDLIILLLTNRDFEPLDALSKDLIAAFAGK